jgi:DNA repair protein RecO (recombination protein O)
MDLHFNVLKTTIGLFAAELLNRAVKEEEPNEDLFDFAQRFILQLDSTAELSMYPLWFCTHLTAFLGFFPQRNLKDSDQFFDLMEGSFTSDGNITHRIEPPYAAELSTILEAHTPEDARLPKQSRLYLLDRMMQYYTLHIPGFGNLKSVQVLGNLLKED